MVFYDVSGQQDQIRANLFQMLDAGLSTAAFVVQISANRDGIPALKQICLNLITGNQHADQALPNSPAG